MINNIGFILSLITLVSNILTCLISPMILIIIMHYLCYNRLKQEDKIVVSLCANIYSLILFSAVILLSFNIQTVSGDLYEKDFNSSPCIFIGYLFIVLFTMLYWTFVNQAFFRLCRIVYSTYRSLQYFRLYIILSTMQLILICICLCPLLVWHNIVYQPTEYYCSISLTDIRGMLWILFNSYGIPLVFLSLIYLHIIIFLRRQTNNQTLVVKQRQQRDLVVLRRIFIIVGLLMTLGIPTIVLLIMVFITGEKHPLSERIVWLSIGLSMLTLNLSLVILTPQLKRIVLKKFQHNRVIPFDGTLVSAIPMRHNTATL